MDVEKYSKNKTFSFYKKGGNVEGGVTVNGGKDGFNNAYDMATAFQQHKNYSELPYTVSAIGDPTKPGKTSIVITFKNHEFSRDKTYSEWWTPCC